jgi:hypothetical protein
MRPDLRIFGLLVAEDFPVVGMEELKISTVAVKLYVDPLGLFECFYRNKVHLLGG